MFKSRGALMVEAAFVIPVFLYLLFNLIFCAFMLYDRHVLGNIVFSNLRTMSANTESNVMINTNAEGGAGLVFHDEAVFAESIYNSVNNNLILYYLDKTYDSTAKKDIYNGINAVIKPHEAEATSEVTDKATYTTTTIKDADVVLTTTVKLKDFVPIMVNALCPNELTCKKQMRIELHLNKVMTVKQ